MDTIYNAGSQIHYIDRHTPWSVASRTYLWWKFT